MVRSACIGFCRSSDNKKLGETINAYIAKKISEQELRQYCKNVRLENIKTQQQIGTDIITSNDFAMYDHMLDATCLVGNIQRRYYWEGGKIPLDIYFSLAFGAQKDKFDVAPLKLQNWLNTNYLYHVPEFVSPIEFAYSDNKPIVEYLEAKSIGIDTRSTIIGPITYLLQGRSMENDIQPLDLIDDILPVYQELFVNYRRIGVKNVQIEDPLICTAIDRDIKDKYIYCYNALASYAGDIQICLATYYGNLSNNFDFICSLPINSLHIDVSYNEKHLSEYADKLHGNFNISLGVVNARNVWKNDLNKSIKIASEFCDRFGEDRIAVSTSSPLFLCPYSLQLEKNVPSEIRHQLSFSVEKLQELEIIKTALNKGKSFVSSELKENKMLFTKKVYTYSFGSIKKYITTTNHESRWHNFVKQYNIKTPAMMFSGNVDIEIQNNINVDFCSAGFAARSYDIADYSKHANGIWTASNNCIPRFGSDYYSPTLVYDNVEMNDNVYVNRINEVKASSDKPIKFNVCSPLHFMNFAFVSPFIDTKKVYSCISDSLLKGINKVIKDVDLLTIVEDTFITNNDCGDLHNTNQINEFCELLNAYVKSVKNAKCIALCVSFVDVNDIIYEISKIASDILLLTAVRSGYDILNVFIKYKPNIPIGMGVIDLYSARTTTVGEAVNSIKKIFLSLDKNNVILTADGDMNIVNCNMNLSKSWHNIELGIKESNKLANKDLQNDKKKQKSVKNKKSKK